MMIIPLFIAMRAIHLLDTRIGLAIAYTSFLLPLFIWMMLGFFRAAPKELEDAAHAAGKNVALLIQREDAQIFVPLRLP